MRSFRHLTEREISEIIAGFIKGETQASLALRFDVDHSTINYHVSRYRKSYPEENSLYAVIKVQARKACLHPSSRCTLCGHMRDELLREERDKIERLTIALKKAHDTLRTAGYAGFVE